MKMQETPLQYNMPDSLENIITVNDSLIKKTDTLKTVVEAKKDGIPFQQSLQQNSWFFGILLFFFIIAVYGINRTFSWLSDAITNLFKVRTRSSIFSKSTIIDYPSKLLLITLSTAIISLYLYLHIFKPGDFNINTFLICFLSSLLLLILKNSLLNLIGFVFLEKELIKNGKEQILILFIFAGLLIFPVLVLRIYLSSYIDVNLYDNLSFIIWIFMLILISFKLFQIFYHKILDFFYIMLYLCTLEILPAIGIYQAYKLIIIEF